MHDTGGSRSGHPSAPQQSALPPAPCSQRRARLPRPARGTYASGSYPGSVHGWGTSNADCYTTWNVDDTLADGHGAGLQFWINDGSNWYVNPP